MRDAKKTQKPYVDINSTMAALASTWRYSDLGVLLQLTR